MSNCPVWHWHDKIACRNIGDETVVVGIENNEVHLLNEVGSFLWNQLEHGMAKEGLIDRLLEEYEVERERAEHDVDEFISQLEQKKLIYRETST